MLSPQDLLQQLQVHLSNVLDANLLGAECLGRCGERVVKMIREGSDKGKGRKRGKGGKGGERREGGGSGREEEKGEIGRRKEGGGRKGERGKGRTKVWMERGRYGEGSKGEREERRKALVIDYNNKGGRIK